jgi:hypothetical protein
MTNNDIVTMDNINNYEAMSRLMGVDAVSSSSEDKKSSTLARVKILHTAIMGEQEIGGKMKNIEVVEAGCYSVELPDGNTVYSNSIEVQPFMQRFSYKRYVQGNGKNSNPENKGYYQKTVMADSLNSDLHDTHGSYNCGKPAGYIKDFKSLSESMQALIKSIKRVRVIFGLVTLKDPIDSSGNSIKIEDNIPFIFEVDNRTSFKTSGEPFDKLAKRRHLPIQHTITFTTEPQTIPTGAVYYTVITELNSASKEISKDDAERVQSFLDWVKNHNDYVMNSFQEHSKNNALGQDEKDLVDEFLGAPDLEGVS